MPSLPGRRYPFGGDVRAVDYGRGDIIPGEADSQGEVFGVWGVNGNGVVGIPSTDSAWEGRGR